MFFQNLTRKNEIGANCYLLELGDTRIVLDCGMNPKEDGNNALPDLEKIKFDTVDGIIVTHAHLDHSGALPILMRQQPSATVFMTEPTAALIDAMLHNSVNVMTSQREELGIREYPFFTHRELDRLEKLWVHRSIGRRFEIGDDGVAATFFDAGHILGSTGVLIEADDTTVFYTGDVNFEDQTLTMGADFPTGPVDALIVETTRGSVERATHYERKHEEAGLAEAINRALERGGSALIPVFAMGKTQEVLIMLDQFKRTGRIPQSAPVFIGGLSTKMTTIFDKFSSSVRRHFPGLQILKDIDIQLNPRRRRRELSYSPGCIYALSSGMMTEKTVSNQFAYQFLDNPKNALLFVGYADPASPGGVIRHAQKGDLITLDKDRAPLALQCDVEVFDFSGHSPREDILEYAANLKPKQTFLVHGDTEALGWFSTNLKKAHPDGGVTVPKPGENYQLNP